MSKVITVLNTLEVQLRPLSGSRIISSSCLNIGYILTSPKMLMLRIWQRLLQNQGFSWKSVQIYMVEWMGWNFEILMFSLVSRKFLAMHNIVLYSVCFGCVSFFLHKIDISDHHLLVFIGTYIFDTLLTNLASPDAILSNASMC